MRPLTMGFWPVRPDIVADNLARFTAATGIPVRPWQVEGDYGGAIERAFAAGEPPDVFYAQRGEAARWCAAGLVRPLDVFAETPAILAEMQPLIRESSQDERGRCIGLTYYNAGPFALFRNRAMLAAAGFGGDAPDTQPCRWDEIERQAHALRRRGLCATPILMRWYPAPTGLPWAFLADCIAEGDRLVDAQWRPLFGPGTGAERVLERWRRLVRDGLASLAALAHDDVSVDAAWLSGRHAFYATMDYLTTAYGVRDPDLAETNAVYPGATGDTLLLGHALLCLSAAPMDAARLDAAWRLLRFLGHRDATGDLFVHKRWAREMNLWTPYPEIDRDPTIRAARRAALPPAIAAAALDRQDAGRARAISPPLVRAPWYVDWADALRVRIETDLLRGTVPVPRILEALRDDWTVRAGKAGAHA